MTTKTAARSFPLRLPASIGMEAERMAAADGTSLDQFVATAVAEKIAARRTVEFFAARRGRVDWEAFDKLMSRGGGQPPRRGDEMPARGRKSPAKLRG